MGGPIARMANGVGLLPLLVLSIVFIHRVHGQRGLACYPFSSCPSCSSIVRTANGVGLLPFFVSSIVLISRPSCSSIAYTANGGWLATLSRLVHRVHPSGRSPTLLGGPIARTANGVGLLPLLVLSIVFIHRAHPSRTRPTGVGLLPFLVLSIVFIHRAHGQRGLACYPLWVYTTFFTGSSPAFWIGSRLTLTPSSRSGS